MSMFTYMHKNLIESGTTDVLQFLHHHHKCLGSIEHNLRNSSDYNCTCVPKTQNCMPK